MYWATTILRTTGWSQELAEALAAWKAHIELRHPLVREVRCYRALGGTQVVWQEGFDTFEDYAVIANEVDDVCDVVMSAVFAHEVPGTRDGGIWADGM
jgi:hypothetical protein